MRNGLFNIRSGLIYTEWNNRQFDGDMGKYLIELILTQAANSGSNEMRINFEGWNNKIPIDIFASRRILPFPVENGKYKLSIIKPEFLNKLREFIELANKYGQTIAIELWQNIYNEWRQWLPWSNNVEGIENWIYAPLELRLNWIKTLYDTVSGLDVVWSLGNEHECGYDLAQYIQVYKETLEYLHKDLNIPFDRMEYGYNYFYEIKEPIDNNSPGAQIKGKVGGYLYDRYGEKADNIRRTIHGMGNPDNPQFLQLIEWFRGGSVKWVVSSDGYTDGKSEYDYVIHPNGKIDRKNSFDETYKCVAWLMDVIGLAARPWTFECWHEGHIQLLPDGDYQIDINKIQDSIYMKKLLSAEYAVSKRYNENFKKLPENYDKYPLPTKPIEPQPIKHEPEPPHPEPHPACHHYLRLKSKWFGVPLYIKCKQNKIGKWCTIHHREEK